jgi:hypothetical protein
MPRIRRTRLVDLRDAGMLEPSQNLRLLLETPKERSGREAGFDHLERDNPARPLLLGFVDRAHPTLADDPQNPVTTDLRR